MEELIIENLKALIATITDLKFVDEDRGQLDTYSMSFPVKWPCALIDISEIIYSDIGVDRTATPRNRQMGNYQVTIRVANMKLTKSSAKAPAGQKADFNAIHGIIQKIHEKLQGHEAAPKSGDLIRSKRTRVKRDDGVQQYDIIYSASMTDV